jgi:Cu-Zn family superoxide dismutase
MSRSFSAIGLSLLFTACGGTPPPATSAPAAAETTAAKEEPAPAEKPVEKAEPAPGPVEVTLEAKSGSKLAGKAVFEETSDGVKVTLTVSGISKGKHGAHVHEKGDCSSADGKSAGDHFNPEGHKHGMPPGAERHLGDLGNLEVGANGEGKHEITIAGANLKAGDKSSFLDRAIIIHEKTDDGGQPTGNAGGRIGCGVIKR